MGKKIQLVDKVFYVEEEYLEGFDKYWCPHFTIG
jgi:hypothetical protein